MNAIRNLALVGASVLSLTVDAVTANAADLVETAAAAASFEILLQAIEAADLFAVLESRGPYTLFAPTDAAFAALPEGRLASLLSPENEQQLADLLTYHLAPGEVLVADNLGTTVLVPTVHGAGLDLDASGQAVTVNGATITTTDILADNGVIHAIDKVLMPPS